MSLYVCYDLKGIQAFIFQIPRLRYIVGGSALIDIFDRETVPEKIRVPGTTWIFSGGGRGAFSCQDDSSADKLERRLVEEAHRIGASIAIGRSAEYTAAATGADKVYPCLPRADELDGHPCSASGLYPVRRGGEHPLVRARIFARGERVFRRFEDALLPSVDHPVVRAAGALEFFHDVSPDDAKDDDAIAGARALGGRNRWAVIAMDGNDMGLQFRNVHDARMSETDRLEWLRAASAALDKTTRSACAAGLASVLAEWAQDLEGVEAAKRRDGTLVLPFRPLILGGDDLLVLCHPAHAFRFVEEACRKFREAAKQANDRWRKQRNLDLWPATGGILTVSAGILFCPVSLPLHTAATYADSLLALAKERGRRERSSTPGLPAPACVDWESITSGLVDHPKESRRRDWTFLDQDIDEIVSLTRRPYLVDDLEGLRSLAKRFRNVPNSIRHEATQALRQAYWERKAWIARVAKHQKAFAEALAEPDPTKPKAILKSRWVVQTPKDGGKPVRSTDILDVLDLLHEEARLDRPTLALQREPV